MCLITKDFRLNIKKVLIIRPDALGDFISVIPVIRTLRKNYPEAKIAVLGSSANKELASFFSEIDNFYNKNDYEKKYWQLVKEIRKEKFDLALVFNHDTKWAYLPIFAGIKNRIGDKYRLGITLLFNKGVYINNADHSQHVFEYNLQYLRCLGIKDQEMVRDIRIQTIFPNKYPELNGQYMVLQLGTIDEPNDLVLLPEIYAQIVNNLHKQSLGNIVLLGEKKFKNFTEKVLKLVEHKNFVSVILEDFEKKDLISILKNATLYIGPTTDTSHLAAFVGVPVVVLKIKKDKEKYSFSMGQEQLGGEKLDTSMVCIPYKTQVKNILPNTFLDLKKEYLVLHVGHLNGTRGRTWTPEAYAQIINKIHQQKLMPIVLTGQKFFAEFTEQILKQVQHKELVFNFNEQTTITDLISLLQNAKAFIGTSTGITHLAAVCGTPVLMLKIVKAEKPIRWYPYGVSHDVVGTERLACPYVCHAYKCTEDDCLKNVDYEDIVKRLFALLEGKFDAEKSFRNTLSILILYNQKTKELKNKVIENLRNNKIRFVEINKGNIFHWDLLWKLAIKEDITVIHSLTWSGYFLAKILGQFLPMAIFVKPLVVSPQKTQIMLQDNLDFYRKEMRQLSERPNKRFWKKL
jgi:ADP-heptose:LPS heptosyltransferase